MTRRGYVAGSLAALVLLVVPVALGSLHTPSDRRPDSSDGRAGVVALVTASDKQVAERITCGSDAASPASLPLTGSLQGARLCATTPRYRRWTAPEPLFDHLDVLAAGLARLEPAPQDYRCFQSGGSYHYDLRLMVDGEVVSLRTQPDCLELTAGGIDYLNSGEPFDAFLEALTAQRSERKPPPLRPTTALDCAATPRGQDHALSPLGDPHEMVEAVSCWRPDSKGDTPPWRGPVDVPPPAIATFVAETRAEARQDKGFDHDPCAGQQWYWQDILGRTRWGDVVVIRGVCETYLLRDVNSVAPEDQEFWHPSPEAQRILDGLRR